MTQGLQIRYALLPVQHYNTDPNKINKLQKLEGTKLAPLAWSLAILTKFKLTNFQ